MIFDSHHNVPDSTNISTWGREIIFSKKSNAKFVINDSCSLKLMINGVNKFGDGKITVVLNYSNSKEFHTINFSSVNSERILDIRGDDIKGSLDSIVIEKKYNSIGKVLLNRIRIKKTSSSSQYNITKKINVAIVVPYNIYGGGEIYLKNLIDSDSLNMFNFHFLYQKENKLSQNISRKNVFHHKKFNFANAKSFFIKNKISCCIFYNSMQIYRTLKSIQKEYAFKIFEIYHSDFKWSDSMAHLSDHDVDCLIKVDENVGRHIICDNVEICRVPIDVDKFRPRSKDFSQSTFRLSKEKCIGVVSRISKEKNLGYVLDLAESMKDFNFYLVGDGVGRKALQDSIRKRNIKNITILGWISDVSKIINGFDSIILPSKMEGTPISILEAMSSNVKAWCYNVGGNKTLINNGAMELCLFEVIDSFNIKEYIYRETKTRDYIYKNHKKDICVEKFLSILDKNLYLMSEDAKKEDKFIGGFYA